MRQADIDDGVVDGQTSAEQNELVQLRREKRRLEMENEIRQRHTRRAREALTGDCREPAVCRTVA